MLKWLFGDQRNSLSPYDELQRDTGASNSKQFDTFVSYSNADVLRVRHIAEQLIAAGHLPWFAEYCIGANRWSTVDSEIENILASGIDQSESGIIFSSPSYSASRWCFRELEAMQCPLVEIECSPIDSQTSPVGELLATIPANRKVALTTIGKSLDFIAQAFRWNPISVQSIDRVPPEFHFDATTGWRINLGGWRYVGEANVHGGSMGPRFERRFGQFDTTLSLMAGPVANDEIPHDDGAIDDRAYRDALIDYVKHYSKLAKVHISGAHLIFVGNRGHFAATYHNRSVWIRKYSLNFPLPADVGQFKSGETWEFVLTFGFHGPFREFCRYAWCFDLVVQSFEWQAHRGHFQFA